MAASPPTIPPLSLDPRAISRHHPRDPRSQEQLRDDAVGQLERAVGAAFTAVERLYAARQAAMADETRPPAAKAADLRRLALQVAERHTGALDGVQAAVQATMGRLAAETVAPPPRDALAAEIRSRLASLPRDDRAAALEAAITSGDRTVVGAVLGAPAFVSGLGDGQVKMIAARWRETHHPDTAARMRRLEHAIDDTARAGAAFMGVVRDLTENKAAVAAEKNASAAAAALQAAE